MDIQPNDLVYPFRFRDIDGRIKICPVRKDVMDAMLSRAKERYDEEKWRRRKGMDAIQMINRGMLY